MSKQKYTWIGHTFKETKVIEKEALLYWNPYSNSKRRLLRLAGYVARMEESRRASKWAR